MPLACGKNGSELSFLLRWSKVVDPLTLRPVFGNLVYEFILLIWKNGRPLVECHDREVIQCPLQGY